MNKTFIQTNTLSSFMNNNNTMIRGDRPPHFPIPDFDDSGSNFGDLFFTDDGDLPLKGAHSFDQEEEVEPIEDEAQVGIDIISPKVTSMRHELQTEKLKADTIPAPSVPDFLIQLHKILSNDANSCYIQWKGGKIAIIDPAGFEEKILPLHFNHSNFSSFSRQMNHFSFRKISGGSRMAPCVFHHATITSDLSSLFTIKRRKPAKSKRSKTGAEQPEKVAAKMQDEMKNPRQDEHLRCKSPDQGAIGDQLGMASVAGGFQPQEGSPTDQAPLLGGSFNFQPQGDFLPGQMNRFNANQILAEMRQPGLCVSNPGHDSQVMFRDDPRAEHFTFNEVPNSNGQSKYTDGSGNMMFQSSLNNSIPSSMFNKMSDPHAESNFIKTSGLESTCNPQSFMQNEFNCMSNSRGSSNLVLCGATKTISTSLFYGMPKHNAESSSFMNVNGNPKDNMLPSTLTDCSYNPKLFMMNEFNGMANPNNDSNGPPCDAANATYRRANSMPNSYSDLLPTTLDDSPVNSKSFVMNKFNCMANPNEEASSFLCGASNTIPASMINSYKPKSNTESRFMGVGKDQADNRRPSSLMGVPSYPRPKEELFMTTPVNVSNAFLCDAEATALSNNSTFHPFSESNGNNNLSRASFYSDGAADNMNAGLNSGFIIGASGTNMSAQSLSGDNLPNCKQPFQFGPSPSRRHSMSSFESNYQDIQNMNIPRRATTDMGTMFGGFQQWFQEYSKS